MAVVVPVFLIASNAALSSILYQVLVILYVVFNLPFAIWLMCSFLNDIPVEIREAAIVDGCSELSVLWRIIPPIGAGGRRYHRGVHLHRLLERVPVRHRHATTLPVQVRHSGTQFGVQWGDGAAAIVIVLPVLIFALLMQRYLVRGMTMGAVK